MLAMLLVVIWMTPAVFATVNITSQDDPCAVFSTNVTCVAKAGCGWCQSFPLRNTPNMGTCYNTLTSKCCIERELHSGVRAVGTVCHVNGTCCPNCYAGGCCAPGMACCEGQCFNADPKLGLSCCPMSYPDDLCGGAAICGPTATCCPGYDSFCCQSGTTCCTDYHGNVQCCIEGQQCLGNSGYCT